MVILLLNLTAIGLLAIGCATQNVNPQQARANTGYVDLYTDSPDGLSWEVGRRPVGQADQEFERIFSELEPPAGGIVRLALAPGRHQLRVTFLNRVITSPAEVEVEVQNGKVTPIRVTLTDAGTVLVRTKEGSVGGTAYGRFGRRTKIGSDESVSYKLSAVPSPPTAYQVKERMPYAR